jgi:hypothetical protein
VSPLLRATTYVDPTPRRLARPRLATGSRGDDYVIEGTASLVTDPERLETFATAFEEAYGWHLTRKDGTWYGLSNQMRSGATHTYFVQPTIILAFGNGEPFSETRYHFD